MNTPTQRSSQPIFTDDFETGDFGAWSRGNPQAGGIATGRNPHSGAYSFEVSIPNPAGSRTVEVSTNIASDLPVFLRFYFYLAPGWNQSPNGDVVLAKLIVGSTPERIYLHMTKSGSLVLKGPLGNLGQTAVELGTWHSLEIQIGDGGTGGKTTITLDGMSEVNADAGPASGPVSIVYVGAESSDTHAAGTLFVDDVVISKAPIGSPAVAMTVRHPNTAARRSLPVDVTMYGNSAADVLTARLGQAEVFRKAGGIRGRERFAVDLKTLRAGDYQLTVSLTDRSGQVKAEHSESLHKFVDGIPLVSIDDHNNIWRGNKTLFALTPYGATPDEWRRDWLGGGYANIYGWTPGYEPDFGYTKQNYKTFIESIGSPCIGPDDRFTGRTADTFAANSPNAVATVTDYVLSLKNNPFVFMWTWKDEPDLGPAPGHVLSARMRELTVATHANDGNHPVIVNLTADTVADRRRGFYYPDPVTNGEWVSDIYSSDYYPFIYQQKRATVSEWTARLDAESRGTYGLVPWYTFVEAGIQPCTNPPVCTGGHGPTPAQVSMEAWLAVIHGIKGISWWGPLAYIDSAHRQAMATFTQTVLKLKDAILSSSAHAVTSDQTLPHARVDVTGRDYNGSVYVFAARLSDVGEDNDPPITTNLTITGFGSGTATVYGENRTVPIVNGVLTDVFAPSETHIYITGTKIPTP